MPALIALCAGFLWGFADFLGGTVSRRLPAAVVAAGSQITGLPILSIVLLSTGGLSLSSNTMLYAAIAGVTSYAGLSMMYHALATGTMGVIAPIVSASAMVPVIVGFLQGDQLKALQYGGIAACLIGILLVTIDTSGQKTAVVNMSQQRAARRAVYFAIAAALTFGASLVFLALASAQSPPSGAFATRLCAAIAAVITVVATRRRMRITAANIGALLLLGTLDASAYLAYSWASSTGQLSIASVLSSLYPVVTAILAFAIHRERLTWIQILGVSTCLGGVVLLAQ